MKNYQEKYTLVADAILEAREANPTLQMIRLELNSTSKLSGFFIREIEDILETLETEHAITGWDFSRPSYFKEDDETPEAQLFLDANLRFDLDPSEDFENWRTGYLKRKTRKLIDLSQLTFEKIYDLIDSIESCLQINYAMTVKLLNRCAVDQNKFPEMFQLCSPDNGNGLKFRADAVEYLENKGIIINKEIHITPVGEWADQLKEHLELRLNLEKFEKFKLAIKKEYQSRRKNLAVEIEAPSKSKPISKTGAVYQVKYTEARDILINDFVLSRPYADSENELVFDYVFKNANKVITQDDIEKNLRDIVLHKPLTKIVENWGFTGQLKKAFFEVSKHKIKFRNPLFEKDLEALGITRLRFPRK